MTYKQNDTPPMTHAVNSEMNVMATDLHGLGVGFGVGVGAGVGVGVGAGVSVDVSGAKFFRRFSHCTVAIPTRAFSRSYSTNVFLNVC